MFYWAFLIFCTYCQSKKASPPASYLAFPTDSTIQIIQSLPGEVGESSGIIIMNGNLWTHNDSGGRAKAIRNKLERWRIAPPCVP